MRFGILAFLFISILITIILASPAANSQDGFYYTYTKAICNGNECADYHVTCENGEISEMNRLTGFVVFDENWEDPRSEEQKEIKC